MPKRSLKTRGQTTAEYYKTHQPRNQGEITQGRGEHWYDGIVDPISNYFGELAYRVENGEIIPGKYTIPGIGAAAATMYAAPILADAFGSTALGNAAIKGASTATKAVTRNRLFPWLDAGLESLALAKGVGDIANNRVSLETPFDLLPATRAVGPVINAARGTTNILENIIPAKGGWYGRAAFDGLTNPLETYRAVKDGSYIKDYSSLRRNIEHAYEQIGQGVKSTNNEYFNLTGIDIPDARIHIKPWKDFSFGTDARFNRRGISSSLTKSRFSNIPKRDADFRRIGGHEQVHAANKWLESNTETPDLGIYKKKILNIVPNYYYVPNRNHKIADKYYWKFILNPNPHGRYPEETWANYMGARAAGMSKNQYYIDNFNREMMFPPKGFLEDYQQYLSDTYKQQSHVFKPYYANGGYIHISPSKRGTFTAAASKHGMGVQEFASRVLRNKDSYSPAMVKKANFARNASKWNH